jgi:ATP-dependent helicase HrpB
MNASPVPRQHPLAVALGAAFERHRDVVLRAPTGAGKSTLVPLWLLQQPFVGGRKIIMLEPRRMAARAVAGRMAALLGEAVGQRVGYRMRHDTRVSAATRIEVLTEGVLTRVLQDDPALEQVACVIFDEFHERSLNADLGLALALDARAQLHAEYRLLVMSATFEGERVARLLGDAGLVSVPGRAFPVQIRYLGRGAPLLPGAMPWVKGAAERSAEREASTAVRRALAEGDGDVLVFLPGAGEIRRVAALLAQSGLPSSVQVLALHGDMAAAAQDTVLAEPRAGVRRVILATNIAETSLTIPGVLAVVDSGLARRSHFDPGSGMSRLELQRISRAASDQRAGRAGRVAPGTCYRLWSEDAQGRLAESTAAEILDADLASLALQLARWGAFDAAALPWLDAPPEAALQQARALLRRLQALDEAGRLTARGLEMTSLPLHPRLAHMLLRARELNAVPLALELAALLSERDLLPAASSGTMQRDPDLRSRLERLRGEGAAEEQDQAALGRVQRSVQALTAALRALPARPRADGSGLSDAAPGALLALAFPDRIGQRRSGGEGRYLLANGRGAYLAMPAALAREEFIVAVDLDDREREARIEVAAPLTREQIEQLFAAQMVTEEYCGWDSRESAVIARRVRRLDALVLESTQRSAGADERSIAAMIEGLRQMGLEALPWEPHSRALRARMEFVRVLARPELRDWPASDDAALVEGLEGWLGSWLVGITRREHLTRLPLEQALRARLDAAQQRALQILAPPDLAVPSGSRIRIDYADPKAPCVAVRLQEVFGLTHTPRVGAGAIAVTFKLLSPAQRPVQITQDLEGFWRSSYVAVRKDMRGRYPRHHWPENPLEATPTRGTGRNRGKASR